MIESIKHKGLKRLLEKNDSSKVNPEHVLQINYPASSGRGIGNQRDSIAHPDVNADNPVLDALHKEKSYPHHHDCPLC